MLIKFPDTIFISGFQICQLQKGLKYCCSALEIKVVTIGCKKKQNTSLEIFSKWHFYYQALLYKAYRASTDLVGRVCCIERMLPPLMPVDKLNRPNKFLFSPMERE